MRQTTQSLISQTEQHSATRKNGRKKLSKILDYLDYNNNYENDNNRMYTMVHQFHKLNPSLCPGCRSGPKTAPLCKACNHILEVLALSD